jgi:hypothetical protein
MINVLFIIPVFIIGFVSCYLYMTVGVNQDDEWFDKS